MNGIQDKQKSEFVQDANPPIGTEKNVIHGMARRKNRNRVYTIWAAMKTRCSNKNQLQYKDYGGRGIYVCKEWLKFENFFMDMGHPPSKKHQIDRIDNNGPYKKENCRWVLSSENIRNSRSVKLSMEIAQEIRTRYREEKTTYVRIANEYGVSKGAVNHVLNNRSWI